MLSRHKDYLLTVGQETERAGVGKFRISGSLELCLGMLDTETVFCVELSSSSIKELPFCFSLISRSNRECLRLTLQGALWTLPLLIESQLLSFRNAE